MPRHNYRRAHARIHAIAAKHSILLDEETWFCAIWSTLKHLKHMKTFANLDIRH